MKTKEELNELKSECEALNNKLKELSESELELVTGGGEFFDWIKRAAEKFEKKIPNSPTTPIYPATQDQILCSTEQDEQILQTYKKDIGSDKNAKVIF